MCRGLGEGQRIACKSLSLRTVSGTPPRPHSEASSSLPVQHLCCHRLLPQLPCTLFRFLTYTSFSTNTFSSGTAARMRLGFAVSSCQEYPLSLLPKPSSTPTTHATPITVPRFPPHRPVRPNASPPCNDTPHRRRRCTRCLRGPPPVTSNLTRCPFVGWRRAQLLPSTHEALRKDARRRPSCPLVQKRAGRQHGPRRFLNSDLLRQKESNRSTASLRPQKVRPPALLLLFVWGPGRCKRMPKRTATPSGGVGLFGGRPRSASQASPLRLRPSGSTFPAQRWPAKLEAWLMPELCPCEIPLCCSLP